MRTLVLLYTVACTGPEPKDTAQPAGATGDTAAPGTTDGSTPVACDSACVVGTGVNNVVGQCTVGDESYECDCLDDNGAIFDCCPDDPRWEACPETTPSG